MEKIGVFYGSDTGCTDDITKDLVSLWGADQLDVREIDDVSKEDFDQFKILILGLSTWYDGDLQSDWEAFYDDFQEIDFTGKVIALYGLGDQIGYGEYFVDGIGILAKVILENGGTIIGHWPIEGYRFTDSVAVIEEKDDHFYGLAIDHDNESELSDARLEKWVNQVKSELKPHLLSKEEYIEI
ncbi:flavodoxin [Aquimarina aquimarini]|uniref:flavodoxin n=1 Tax=Aquimarina aquimarini TaxID=1191734 RepID=UPI000D5523BE|nr:flavodoxin [Aquimarina aquimarini]